MRYKVRPIHKRVLIVQRANINRKDRTLVSGVLIVRQDMHLLRHQPVVRRVLDPHTKDKTVQQMLLVTRGPRVRLVSSHLLHHPLPTIVCAVIVTTVNINQKIRLLAQVVKCAAMVGLRMRVGPAPT